MLHLLLDCNVVSMSGVFTSVSSTLGYLLLFHPILEYPILRPPIMTHFCGRSVNKFWMMREGESEKFCRRHMCHGSSAACPAGNAARLLSALRRGAAESCDSCLSAAAEAAISAVRKSQSDRRDFVWRSNSRVAEGGREGGT